MQGHTVAEGEKNADRMEKLPGRSLGNRSKRKRFYSEELEKIMKAQTARGIDFESGGLLKRVKSMVPIIVPLFVAAIRRANDLAMAMESRCYHGGVGRTKLKPLKYEKRDKIAYIVLFVFLAVMIYLSFFSPWR